MPCRSGLVVFPGSGVTDNLADKPKRLGIPHFRSPAARPLNTRKFRIIIAAARKAPPLRGAAPMRPLCVRPRLHRAMKVFLRRIPKLSEGVLRTRHRSER
ncbi:MAG: hypothetical protein R3C54_01805 [Parvularculaceae bacterium]